MPAKHRVDFMVRDYELDAQGIVNNANYLHYMEHARHQFLKQANIDVVAMHQQGYDLVLTETRMKYFKSLTSGQNFYVTTQVTQVSRLRFAFEHIIFLSADDSKVTECVSIGTCIDTYSKRPILPDELKALIA